MNETEWFRVTDGKWAPPLDEWERPIGDGESFVQIHSFRVVKVTACGVWLDAFGARRFVLRDSRKRFACPTKKEALDSFRARKTAQLRILRKRIRHVERCLTLSADPSLLEPSHD